MRKRLAPVLVLPWLFILGGTGTAADPESVDLFDLSLEELSQVKVSVASRRSQLLREASSVVTVFTESDIRRLGVRTLAELLGYVPGMYSYRNGGTSAAVDNYEARGVRDNFNTMMLLMIDGRRINYPHNGGSAHLMLQSLANAERVEIIRGPGSALYGSSAVLGVINIITRTDANEVAVGIGTDGNREALVSASFDQEDWRGSLHMSRQQTDGQTYTDIFDVTDRVNSTRDPLRAETWQTTLGYRQFSLHANTYRQRAEEFYQVNFVNPDNRSYVKGYDVGLHAEWQNSEQDFRLHTQLSRNDNEVWAYANRAEQGTFPFLVADWFGGYYIDAVSDVAAADAIWGFEPSYFDASHTFGAGIRFARERIREASLYSNYRLTDFAYVGEVQAVNELLEPTERDIVGIYVQAQTQWSTQWQSTLGVRHDDYRDFDSAVSPRLAIQFHDGMLNTFKLMAGRAYRAPAPNELYTSGNPVTIGNTELEPVHAQTIELMWLHEAKSIRFESSLFEQQLDDLIVSEFIAPGLRQFTNNGELRVRGIELGAQLPITEGWRAGFHGTRITDIQEKFGNSTGQDSGERNTPHQWGGLELNYAAERWSWHLGARYMGKIKQLSEQEAYWLWRTHFIWSWKNLSWNKQLDLTLTINNLFDEQYRTLASIGGFGINNDGDVERALPGRGRELWLRLESRW